MKEIKKFDFPQYLEDNLEEERALLGDVNTQIMLLTWQKNHILSRISIIRKRICEIEKESRR